LWRFVRHSSRFRSRLGLPLWKNPLVLLFVLDHRTVVWSDRMWHCVRQMLLVHCSNDRTAYWTPLACRRGFAWGTCQRRGARRLIQGSVGLRLIVFQTYTAPDVECSLPSKRVDPPPFGRLSCSSGLGTTGGAMQRDYTLITSARQHPEHWRSKLATWQTRRIGHTSDDMRPATAVRATCYLVIKIAALSVQRPKAIGLYKHGSGFRLSFADEY
jgi:hypothetical protein